MKFGISVLQSEAVKNLQSFAENNKETQGKFTIADEKVSFLSVIWERMLTYSSETQCLYENGCELIPCEESVRYRVADMRQDPEIQKATGKTDPVEVMAKLREMKNNFK